MTTETQMSSLVLFTWQWHRREIETGQGVRYAYLSIYDLPTALHEVGFLKQTGLT